MDDQQTQVELATLTGGPFDGQLVSALPTRKGSVTIETTHKRRVVYTRRRPIRKRHDGSFTYDFVGWL